MMNVSDERCSKCGAGVTGEKWVYCGECREEVLIQYSALGGNIGNKEFGRSEESESEEGGDGNKEAQKVREEGKDTEMKQRVVA